MVKLNVIYTTHRRQGRDGTRRRVAAVKSDARVAAMGDVDETNCAIGLALLAVATGMKRPISRSSRC